MVGVTVGLGTAVTVLVVGGVLMGSAVKVAVGAAGVLSELPQAAMPRIINIDAQAQPAARHHRRACFIRRSMVPPVPTGDADGASAVIAVVISAVISAVITALICRHALPVASHGGKPAEDQQSKEN